MAKTTNHKRSYRASINKIFQLLLNCNHETSRIMTERIKLFKNLIGGMCNEKSDVGIRY